MTKDEPRAATVYAPDRKERLKLKSQQIREELTMKGNTADTDNKACSPLVFGRVTRRTRWPRVVGSFENLPGYPVYKDYRDLC